MDKILLRKRIFIQEGLELKNVQNFTAIRAIAFATSLLLIVTALDTSSFFVHGQNMKSAKKGGAASASDVAISLGDSYIGNITNSNITLKKDQVLNVTITGNPGVGDNWNATFDKNILQLISSDIKFSSENPPPGSDGTFVFIFKALKNDITTIKFYNNFRGQSPFNQGFLPRSPEKILIVQIV